jgi:hypothetical protein
MKELLDTVNDVYEFVNAYAGIEDLDDRRRKLLTSLLDQTVECAHLIRDHASVRAFCERPVLSGSNVH